LGTKVNQFDRFLTGQICFKILLSQISSATSSSQFLTDRPLEGNIPLLLASELQALSVRFSEQMVVLKRTINEKTKLWTALRPSHLKIVKGTPIYFNQPLDLREGKRKPLISRGVKAISSLIKPVQAQKITLHLSCSSN